MNYRHAFHAGNFADVVKHALLARVLIYLVRKPGALRFLDTHAGTGRYDLSSDEASRTGEWRSGIGAAALWNAPPPVAELLAPYLDAVGPRDPDGRPLSYPGSPALAQALLRSNDRIALCELHRADAEALRIGIGRDRRITVMQRDGYAALNALLPPPERRGLVLIDPPFEEPDEFDRLSSAFLAAHRKWPTGTYLLWYPIKDRVAVTRFAGTLQAAGIPRILQIHLFVGDGPAGKAGLAGMGLVAVNPPHVLQGEAEALLSFLTKALGRSPEAAWSCRLLAGE
ncbi:MAG TPA: 23S rRNA (adenine(2030)-N(6))-methyltransferase RlmJ [Lichenihabitans sp.]|nr:23S rRNA (adenine(2030)-N(6))-methyltransferase RlmJ [Lichenihabitans sp.]